MTAAVDSKALARAERADLATFLAELTPDQWEVPTLCAGWRVRDLVAHVYSYEELGVVGIARRFLVGGLRLDRVNAARVAELADVPPAELVAMAQRCVRPRGLTTAFGGRVALTDAMIHQQDIRRPLGIPREVPADRLRCALDFARTAPPLGAKPRIGGLTLTTTDLDWTWGSGPAVEGPGEALLLAMAGRGAALDELSGPGAAILAQRLTG